jgi:type IV pilus assembly protein PilQ
MKKNVLFIISSFYCLVALFPHVALAGTQDWDKDGPGQSQIPGKIIDLEFWRDEHGYLYADLNGLDIPSPSIISQDDTRLEVLIPQSRTSLSLVRLHRLDDFETGISSLFLQNTASGTRLVWTWDGKMPFEVAADQKKLNFRFVRAEETNNPEQDASRLNPDVHFSALSQKPLSHEINALFPGMKENYTGDLVSIDLQNAEVEHAIRLITSITDFNLILDQDVRGRVSLRLINVPWDQALDLVLVQKNLAMVHWGNIIRITTAEKLKTERDQVRKAREAEAEARESMKRLEPLERKFIQVNYSTAGEILPQIKDFLSDRGKVTHDARTNTLTVQETSSRLQEIKAIVQNLDRPEKQVLIEARVVYATEEFRRGLGLHWNFMYPEQNAFSPSGKILGSVNFQSMNFPNMPDDFISLGGTLRSISGSIFTLDAQLRLGETQRISRTISAPRIVTLNNEMAEIEQGVQIPYITLDDAGNTTTEFIPATLKLSVTPQITWDDNIIISLEVSDDNPAFVLDQASVETRLAKTKLLVEDGETIVLGGIKKIVEDQTQNRVPGLANIPVLGWLFKNEFLDERKDELLIFIRPEIL